MSAENATVNLYINNEQAIAAVDALRLEYLRLKDARKLALNEQDYQKAADLDAQMLVAKRQLTNATKGQLDVEKALANINKINIDQLYQVRKSLSNEVRTLNRDTEEYIQNRERLVAVENEIKRASTSANAEQQKGLTFLQKITPTIDLGSLFMRGISMAKEFIGEIWSVSQRLQSDAKKAATVFGDELGYVEYQATQLSKAMGVTEAKFVSLTANTADLLVPLGFTRKEAAEMAVDLQTLTGALNEWSSGQYGAEEISARLTKAVLGETESLKQLGVSIRMDSAEYKDLVKAKMEDGEVTEMQARAMATLELIYAKTEDAQASYASSGNELLRFQSSASRGWDSMIEAIGEWFAFSNFERAEKSYRLYNEMSKVYERNEGLLDDLIPVYTELTSKVDLSEAEQAQLNSAILEIATIVPEAVTKFDEYGNALDISTAKVNIAREAQRLLRKEMHQDVASGFISSIADAGSKLKRLRDEVDILDMSDLFKDDVVLQSERNDRLETYRQESTLVKEDLGRATMLLQELGWSLDDIAEASGSWWRGVDFGTDELQDYIDLYEQKQSLEARGSGDGGGKVSAYDLSKDQDYNAQALALKKQLADGEIKTETEKQKKLLNLEIAFLQKQIDSKVYSAEQVEAMEVQILDRRIALQKTRTTTLTTNADAAHKKELAAEAKRQQELDKVVLSGKDTATQAKAQYDARLKALGLFGKDEQDMTATEKAALLQLEREFGDKLATLRLAEANTAMQQKNDELEARLSAQKIAQAKELEEATSLREMHLILSRYYSAEELAKVTDEAKARNLILQQYDAERAAQSKDQLVEMLAYYQDMYSELSEQGTLFGVAYDLDPAELAEVESKILAIKEQLAELGLSSESDSSTSGRDKKVDILGMSASDWEDLFTNFDTAKDKLSLIEGAVGVISDAWGSINDLISAAAERELSEYEAAQEAKAEALEERLDAGLISEAYYNEQIALIEEETDAKTAELELEAAERERALAVFNATISTAAAVVKALEAGPIAGPILAGIIGALGAVQIATILATPLTGVESGGYIDVVRSQDSKHFNARLSPDGRGYIDSPTVIVGESGDEFVASNEAVSNPTIRPILDIIDQAQRNGSVGQLNLSRELTTPTTVMLSGRASGGYLSTPDAVVSSSSTTPVTIDNTDLIRVIQLLTAKLSTPLKAYVVLSGRDGLIAQLDKYDQLQSNTKI